MALATNCQLQIILSLMNRRGEPKNKAGKTFTPCKEDGSSCCQTPHKQPIFPSDYCRVGHHLLDKEMPERKFPETNYSWS